MFHLCLLHYLQVPKVLEFWGIKNIVKRFPGLKSVFKKNPYHFNDNTHRLVRYCLSEHIQLKGLVVGQADTFYLIKYLAESQPGFFLIYRILGHC